MNQTTPDMNPNFKTSHEAHFVMWTKLSLAITTQPIWMSFRALSKWAHLTRGARLLQWQEDPDQKKCTEGPTFHSGVVWYCCSRYLDDYSDWIRSTPSTEAAICIRMVVSRLWVLRSGAAACSQALFLWLLFPMVPSEHSGSCHVTLPPPSIFHRIAVKMKERMVTLSFLVKQNKTKSSA